MQLRPPAERVSPRAKRYWALRALAGWLVVIGLELLLLAFILRSAWSWPRTTSPSMTEPVITSCG